MGFLRNSKPKVFCIGANKTGTTSVEKTLKNFGYKMGKQAKAELLIHEYSQRNFKPILKYCRTAEAFQDIPFSLPYTYVVLHHHFKNAKFILTERESAEQWYHSLVKFHSKLWSDGTHAPTAQELKNAKYRYKGYPYEAHKYLYSTPDDDLYNQETLIAFYTEHNKAVKNYFKDIPNSLLCINVSKKEDYKRLSDFLNVSSNQTDFPWENKTS
ncbi:sulfotransferase [Marixanthomonas ophiurae]|uniref:Sulfotransferase family protein n=1 Tax=Marixanthomonas ophiurae TaxID=387659 RepID=A0A3E1QD12_9FLAO|nr:sulfotransferase [Marixanthomonas ophiurae]RFN60035.1 hypothetical protein DZ858_08300 [Marixanthomonas ophiurae]